MDPYEKLKHSQVLVETFNSWSFRHVTRAILRVLQQHDCRKVLEVCCGTGKLLQVLAKQGMDVTGVDASKTMLDRAKKKKRAEKLFLMDATQMKFQEEFDAAIIQIALHEMTPTRSKAYDRMKMAIIPNGLIIIADFAKPDAKALGARISGFFIRRGEEFFIDFYPEHYYNYLQFLQSGGLKAFLKNENLLSFEAYMGGNLELACLSK